MVYGYIIFKQHRIYYTYCGCIIVRKKIGVDDLDKYIVYNMMDYLDLLKNIKFVLLITLDKKNSKLIQLNYCNANIFHKGENIVSNFYG